MKKRSADLAGLARSEQRFPTKFAATVIADRVPMAVDIANLSRLGACLRGPTLPRRGATVVLRATGLEVVATVAWNNQAACGLTFHEPIAPLFVVHRNMPLRELDLHVPARTMFSQRSAA